MGAGGGFREWMPALAGGGSWECWRLPSALLIVALSLLAVGRIVEAVRARATARKWAAIARQRAILRERQVSACCCPIDVSIFGLIW